MAILNYADGKLEVLNYLQVTTVKDTKDKDKAKLFFTGDGDIITHGVNYLPLYNEENVLNGKGLVPVPTSAGVLKSSGWGNIGLNDLPMYEPGETDVDKEDETLISTSNVKKLFTTALKAVRFKGLIQCTEEKRGEDLIINSGAYLIGDLWYVQVTSGNIGEHVEDIFDNLCESGDMLICVSKSGDPVVDWQAILGNVEAVLLGNINGGEYYFSGAREQSSGIFNLYAPTTPGSKALLLIGSDNNKEAPLWATINGHHMSIYTGPNGNTVNINIANENKLGLVQIGNNISYTESGLISITAENICNALSIKGIVTGTHDGLVPKFGGSENSSVMSVDSRILGVDSKGTVQWFTMHQNSFENTWRPIYINGTQINDIGLDIRPSGDLCIMLDDENTENVYELALGINWYNISANNGQGGYETS